MQTPHTPRSHRNRIAASFYICCVLGMMCCALPAQTNAPGPGNPSGRVNSLREKALQEWLAASNDLHRLSLKYPEVFAAERDWKKAEETWTKVIAEETTEAKKHQQEIRDRLEERREQRLQEYPEYPRALKVIAEAQFARHTNANRLLTLRKELAQSTNAAGLTESEKAKRIAALTEQIAATKAIGAQAENRGNEAAGVVARLQREVQQQPEIKNLEKLYMNTMMQNWDAWSVNERLERARKEMNEKRQRYQELLNKYPEISLAKQKADSARAMYEKYLLIP